MATSGPTIWTSIEPTSALEERPGPGRWRDLRAAINFADSLRLALPVKTMAVAEYISSSLSARFPDKMAQKRWTSLPTSSVEILFIFSLKDSTGLHSVGRSQRIPHVLGRARGARQDLRDSRSTRKPETNPTSRTFGALATWLGACPLPLGTCNLRNNLQRSRAWIRRRGDRPADHQVISPGANRIPGSRNPRLIVRGSRSRPHSRHQDLEVRPKLAPHRRGLQRRTNHPIHPSRPRQPRQRHHARSQRPLHPNFP